MVTVSRHHHRPGHPAPFAQRQRPRLDALPFMVTKRLAVRISLRWSITSGMVMQIRTTATAAIRW